MMRFMQTLMIFAVTQSCSVLPVDSRVSVFLQPIHYTSLTLNANSFQQVQLLDNDGNIYITYWDVNASLLASFNDTVKKCRERMGAKKIFGSSKNVSDLNVTAIVPSMFKGFNLCIGEGGYVHKYSDAFSPEKFALNFFKGHSTSENYLPVGGNYFIYKKGNKFRDALVDVKKCKSTVDKLQSNGGDEVYTGNFIYVSVESYIKSMRECLSRHSYRFIKA